MVLQVRNAVAVIVLPGAILIPVVAVHIPSVTVVVDPSAIPFS
jgi:hypothetical protein